MTAVETFFLPGPVAVHPEVLDALREPMIGHRSPEGRELFARVQPGLQEVFGTRGQVFVLTASGTGAVEAGVRALPAGRVLSLVNGAFSERFAQIAEACGHEVERLEVPWGDAHDADAVAARLAAGRHGAVTAVHNETSTGALQDLDALARAAGRTPLLVDSVSGAAGTALDFDRRGLGYACTGSQKALALPPGLAFAAAAPALLAGAERARGRGFYLDLLRYRRPEPPFTPAIPLLRALAVQLGRIAREGLARRYARHREMAERTWAWAAAKGLRVLAAAGRRSPTVTCILLPDGLPGPEFVQRVRRRGYTVGSGYGPLKETAFRIGHMGEHTPATLDRLLSACDEALIG